VELLNKAAPEKRLTLAPVYVPGTVDLHGEYTTAAELEKAVLSWNATGDRTLRLQHQEGTVAGEILSLFVWPTPYEADVFDHRGILKAKHRFNAGSAFSWVRWTPEAWQLVKSGQITGLSMGGSAKRIRVGAETDGAGAKSASRGNMIQRVAREGSVRLS
jgi:hypothetical protein